MRVDAIDSGTSRKHGHCVASERLAPVTAALKSKAWHEALIVAAMAAKTAAGITGAAVAGAAKLCTADPVLTAAAATAIGGRGGASPKSKKSKTSL